MDANERLSTKSPLNRMNLHMLFFKLARKPLQDLAKPSVLFMLLMWTDAAMWVWEFFFILFCFFKREGKKCTFEIDVNSLSTPQAKNQALEGTPFFFFWKTFWYYWILMDIFYLNRNVALSLCPIAKIAISCETG